MRSLSLNEVKTTFIYVAVSLLLNSVFCEVEVKITKGALKGKILKSRNGRPYNSFTGIPYAKPPIGELRLEVPKQIDPWKGILDATKIPKPCLQKEIANSGEDCLYLNVYTPNTDGNLPVMFWIHGGAFYLLHSGSDIFGPDYFMDKNVVLVSVNYRLGALGYLSTEDEVIPGNYGMKDQVMALRWVQENIVKFGGNSGEVTIFGGSSGGVSAGYHMISSMSKGLFHKAILQSGTPFCRWSTSFPGVARNRSKIVSNIAGCPGKTSKDILKCFKTLPASFFADVYEKLHEWHMYPSILFAPVVEQCNSDQDGFLCQNHLYDFKQVSFVPTIIGMNSAEGGMVTAALYNDTSLRFPEFYTDFNHLISIILSYQHFTLDLDVIGELVLHKYYPSGKIEDHSHLNTVEMITDGRYLHGIFDMAFKLSSPVYFYLFDHQNEFSYNTLYGNGICNKYLGVTHGDELTSLFKSNFVRPKELNMIDTNVSTRMVDIWSKFASSKIPTVDGTENGSVWPTFSLQNQTILHISSDRLSVVKNPFEKKYLFWNKLPLFSNLNNLINTNMFSTDLIKNEL